MSPDPRPRRAAKAFGWHRALGACCALLALSGCDSSAKAQSAERPPAAVNVAVPLVEEIVEWDAYTGRLAAVESVEVRSRVSGYLQSIHFQEGRLVQKGQLLFVIDPRPFEVEVARAEAAVRQSEASLLSFRARYKQAQADRVQVKAQVQLAEVRQRRADRLANSGAATQETLDQTRSELAQAKARLNAAAAAIASAEATVHTAEADLAAARVTLDGAKLELSYTRITAAITGLVDRRIVTQGNYVQGGGANGTLLTTIVSVDPIHVTFDASERDLLKYIRLDKLGARKSSRETRNPVYAGLLDEDAFPHQGHMDFVGTRMDTATATIRGRAILPNPELILTPGQFAKVRIPGSPAYPAVMIPDAAVGADQSVRFVMVLGEDSTVARRPVTLGPRIRGLRVIRKGLAAGERFVVDGLQLVRPGAKVNPTQVEVTYPEQASSLPNVYEPVPREKWLRPEVAAISSGGGR